MPIVVDANRRKARAVTEVRGALTGLVHQLRQQQGWTMDRLAEAAGMSEQALQIDAWVLERAASSPRENVDELLPLADRMSGGTLARLRRIIEDAVPDSLEDAVRMARPACHRPTRSNWRISSPCTRMDPTDREFLLALAVRLLEGPLADD